MTESLDNVFLGTIETLKVLEPPEGFLFADSGGKDSCVVRDVLIRGGIKYQGYYTSTGIDAPELVKFIKREHPETKFLYPNYKGHRSFFGMLRTVGPPSPMRRWCCAKLKENPFRQLGKCVYLTGVRAEESRARAKKGPINKRGKQLEIRPLFHRKVWEVWEYIERYKVPYSSLYDEGFERLGCVVCMFHNKKQHELYRSRWPKFFVAFEKAMKDFWETKGKGNYRETEYEAWLESWYAKKW